MKCDLNVSEESSMSANLPLKFRILALVINTADLINERTTPSLSIGHAVLAPVTLTTTFIVLGIMVLGALSRRYASFFMQIYGLVCCASLHISLSILVFRDLKYKYDPVTNKDIALVLNGVLPMLIIILIITDLIIIMFSKRDDLTLPSSAESSHPEYSRYHATSTHTSSTRTPEIKEPAIQDNLPEKNNEPETQDRPPEIKEEPAPDKDKRE